MNEKNEQIMKIIYLSIAAVLLVACNTQQEKRTEPLYRTNECRTYYSMSIAPMAPHAIEALRMKCEESLYKK